MNRKSNKTAHVMKLLAGGAGDGIQNPILNEAFKEEVILSHNNSLEEKDNKEVTVSGKKIVTVNVIAELISENIDKAIQRFKCCSCELCRAEITANTLEIIEPQYAVVTGNSSAEVDKLKKKYKSAVISAMVKNIIKLKSNPIHN